MTTTLPNVTPAAPRQRGPLGRGATVTLLAALVLVVGGLVAYFNTKIIGIILDETLLKQSAVRYTRGLPDSLLHDPDARATSRLYSLVISPLFAAFHGDVAVRLARGFNGFAFASTAIPTFLLARMALSRRRSLLVAAAAITVPWLTLTTAIFAESLAYPLAIWALLAMAWSWRRPGLLTDVLVLLTVGLATVTRVQFVGLFAVYAILIVWRVATIDRPANRRAILGVLRTFPATALLIVLGLGFLLLRKIGVVNVGPSLSTVVGESYATTTTARATVPSDVGLAFSVQILLFALGVGILPLVLALIWLPGALRAKMTRSGPAVIAVLSVAATVGIWGTVMYSQGGPIGPLTEERYYFYTAPLLWICAAIAWSSPSVTPRRILGVGGGVAVLALLIALPQGPTQESSFFAPASAGWTWITLKMSTAINDVLGIAGFGLLDLLALSVLVIVAVAAFLVRRFGRRGVLGVLALGLTLQLMLTAINFAAINWRIDGWPGRTGTGFSAFGFIDRATNDRPVTWVHDQRYVAETWDAVQRTALFYNDTILQTASFPALALTPVNFPMNSLPMESLEVHSDGRVTGGPPLPFVTPFAVQTLGSPFVQLRGHLLAGSPLLGLGVYDVGLHPRADWYLTGLDPYGQLAPDVRGHYLSWTRGVTLTVAAENPTTVRIRAHRRTRTVKIPGGGTPIPVKVTGCTAPAGGRITADAPFTVISAVTSGAPCPTP